MAKERNLVYDAIKLFAILMVLWGHAVAYLQTSDPTENPVFTPFTLSICRCS